MAVQRGCKERKVLKGAPQTFDFGHGGLLLAHECLVSGKKRKTKPMRIIAVI